MSHYFLELGFSKKFADHIQRGATGETFQNLQIIKDETDFVVMVDRLLKEGNSMAKMKARAVFGAFQELTINDLFSGKIDSSISNVVTDELVKKQFVDAKKLELKNHYAERIFRIVKDQKDIGLKPEYTITLSGEELSSVKQYSNPAPQTAGNNYEAYCQALRRTFLLLAGNRQIFREVLEIFISKANQNGLDLTDQKDRSIFAKLKRAAERKFSTSGVDSANQESTHNLPYKALEIAGEYHRDLVDEMMNGRPSASVRRSVPVEDRHKSVVESSSSDQRSSDQR